MLLKSKVALGVSALATILVSNFAQAISVTYETDADTLANGFGGTGVTISNASFAGTSIQAGTFTDGSVVGIDSGVILSTGDVADVSGPNSADGTTSNTGSGSHAGLSDLAGFGTNDAAVLTFDFEITDGSTDVFFNFVFGSEEYNEYVNSSYNDVFAFYIDGVNTALLPNGDAVSINTVNNSVNSSLYNDNDYGDTSTPFNTEMDGFTDVITISAIGLAVGTHTMEIAIADAGDSSLDSWVLMQANSFSTETLDTPLPASAWLLGTGLLALMRMRKKK